MESMKGKETTTSTNQRVGKQGHNLKRINHTKSEQFC